MKKLNISVYDIVLFALSLLLCIGSATFFSACGPKDDGSWMSCHWAQTTVSSIGAVLSAISLAAVCVPDRRVKAGLDLAAVFAAILAALVPGALINLCMMPEMQCRSVMQPVSILVASLIAVAALVSAILNLKKKDK